MSLPQRTDVYGNSENTQQLTATFENSGLFYLHPLHIGNLLLCGIGYGVFII